MFKEILAGLNRGICSSFFIGNFIPVYDDNFIGGGKLMDVGIINSIPSSSVQITEIEEVSSSIAAQKPHTPQQFESNSKNKLMKLKYGKYWPSYFDIYPYPSPSPSPKTDLAELIAHLDYDGRGLFIPSLHELSGRLDELTEFEIVHAIQRSDKYLLKHHKTMTHEQMGLFLGALQKLLIQTGTFVLGFSYGNLFLSRCIDDLNTGDNDKIQARLLWLSMAISLYPPDQRQDVLITLANILPLCAGEWFDLCKNLMMGCLLSLDEDMREHHISKMMDRLGRADSARISDLVVAQHLLREGKKDVLAWESILIKVIRVATNYQGQVPVKQNFDPIMRIFAGHLLIEALTTIPDDPDLKRNPDFKHQHRAEVCKNTDRCYDDMVSYDRIRSTLFSILESPDRLKFDLLWQDAFVNLRGPEKLGMIKIFQDAEENPDPAIRYFYYTTQINCLMTQSDKEFPVTRKITELRNRMLADPDEQIKIQGRQIFDFLTSQ